MIRQAVIQVNQLSESISGFTQNDSAENSGNQELVWRVLRFFGRGKNNYQKLKFPTFHSHQKFSGNEKHMLMRFFTFGIIFNFPLAEKGVW